MGKRINRGLFRSGNGTLIHADLNGSYNLIRKAIPETFANGIGGDRVIPTKFKRSAVLWIGNFQRWMLTWLTEIIT